MALLLGTTAPDMMLFPYIKLPATGSRMPSISRGSRDECDDKTCSSGHQSRNHKDSKVANIKTIVCAGYPAQVRVPDISPGLRGY